MQDGEHGLVQLHNDVADTVIRNEELILSNGDKVSIFLNPVSETGLMVLRCAGGASLGL